MALRALTHEQTMDYKQRLQDALQGTNLVEPDTGVSEAEDISSLLDNAERRLASPTLRDKDYTVGTAVLPDEMLIIEGEGSLLFTTEHATTHFRTIKSSSKVKKDPETGTAALAAILAAETRATHLTMLGMQTGDANYDNDHPFKRRMTAAIDEGHTRTMMAVHGMVSGKVADLEDDKGFDVVVGVGINPSERTLKLGAEIVTAAQSYGLRAGINQPLLKIEEVDGELFVRVDDNGDIKPITFAASKARTTRATAENHARQQNLDIACVQVELAETVRLAAVEVERTERAAILGPYLGYGLLRSVAG